MAFQKFHVGLVAAAVTAAATVQAGDLVSFTNSETILTFSTEGQVAHLIERATGRELHGWGRKPFAGVEFADGTKTDAVSARDLGGGRLAFALSDNRGEAVVSVKTEPWGWVFTAEDLTATNAVNLTFARLNPSLGKWIGAVVLAKSDEKSAAVLRPLDFRGEAGPIWGTGLLTVSVRLDAPYPWKGARAGLAAGRRDRIPALLEGMLAATDLARTKLGGPWCQTVEETRRAYVFAAATEDTIDGWIDLAERSGMGIIHLTEWWQHLGHYPVNTTKFPDGYAAIRRMVDKIHAAGLLAGTHSLTRSISPNGDKSVSPVASSDLQPRATYHLARSLGKTDDVVYVAERPIDEHALVGTFGSNGNYLRIGGEILQYSGIDREHRPYAFTGVTRGRLGTKRADAASGEVCDYLLHGCGTFFPKIDTPLSDEIAASIAAVYNNCNLDEIYFDGAGIRHEFSNYANFRFMDDVIARLDQSTHPALIESATYEPSAWWYRGRIGALDHTLWGMKFFTSANLAGVINLSRDSNFLAPQGGWWCARLADGSTRGHFIDDMEFFAGKTAARDIPPSVQIPGKLIRNDQALPVHLDDMLTVLGWYERARLARAFRDEVVAALKPHPAEGRLRQGADGTWRFRPVALKVHRSALPSERQWTADFPFGGPAALRVEALYGADLKQPCTVMFSATTELKTASAKGVEVELRKLSDAEKGPVVFLKATNKAAEQKGAWARAQVAYPLPYRNGRHGQYGVWVRGDGSGALLNIQFQMGKEYFHSCSDHHIRLNFTGWQQVVISSRERDAAAAFGYTWPYPTLTYDTCRYWYNPHVVETVSVYLNDIPKGSEAKVAVSEIVSIPRTDATVENAVVSVNGEAFKLPFALKSGDFAELEDGWWVRYSDQGERLQRVRADRMPRVRAGKNDCAFAAAGERPRVEVTVAALGQETEAFRPLTDQMKRTMSYEAMRPMAFAPSRGFATLDDVVTRPGETAKLDLTLVGPIADPVLELKASGGVSTLKFPTLGSNEVYRIKDGPSVTGRCSVCLVTSDPSAASARLTVVKRYGGSIRTEVRRAETSALKVQINAAKRDTAELARYDFEEGVGVESTEAVSGKKAVLSPAMRWVRGGFGLGLAFGKPGASADLGEVAGLDGRDDFSLFFRLRLQDEAKDLVPVVSSKANGLAVSLAGRRMKIALAGKSVETEIELKKWTLVGVVCAARNVTVYVGEKPVGNWRADQPLKFGGLTLGGADVLPAFVDDFRAYGRALDEDAVFGLATAAKYEEQSGYQPDGAGAVLPIEILDNDGKK